MKTSEIFTDTSYFVANKFYRMGEMAFGSDNNLYVSKTNGNKATNPAADVTNWGLVANNITAVTAAVNAARDNINTQTGAVGASVVSQVNATTNSKGDAVYNGLVGHITNTAATYDRYTRSCQIVTTVGLNSTGSGPTENGTFGSQRYIDVALNAVNLAKAVIIPLIPVYSAGTGVGSLTYRFISSNIIRMGASGAYGGSGIPAGCYVLEFI